MASNVLVGEKNAQLLRDYLSSGKDHLNILIVGDTGSGKSALVNDILSMTIAKESLSPLSQTLNIKPNKMQVQVQNKAVSVTIWDTPAIDERTINDIEVASKEADVIFYCFDMRRKLGDGNKFGIMELTKRVGPEVWNNVVFVLTFANELKPPPGSSEEIVSFFKEVAEKWQKIVTKALKREKVPDAIADSVAIVPTGYGNTPPPDRKDWFTPFWLVTFDRTKDAAKSALLGINLYRMETEPLCKVTEHEVHTALDQIDHKVPAEAIMRALAAIKGGPLSIAAGVHTIAVEKLSITDRAEHKLNRWEYGFKLIIPEDSLPSGTNECTIEVLCSLTRSNSLFQFPIDAASVVPSGLYHIKISSKLQKPLLLQLEHCARTQEGTQLSYLHFVTAVSSYGPPYHFKYPEEDDYTIEDYHGEVKLLQSSWVAIVTNNLQQCISYSGAYYRETATATKQHFHFTTVKNLHLYKQVVEDHFAKMQNTVKVNEVEVLFADDGSQITLGVTENGLTTPEGWRITPNKHPALIRRSDIDSYTPDTDIPTCTLLAIWEGAVPPVHHIVPLVGAKTPKSFLITSERKEEVSSACSEIYPDGCPSMQMLLAFPAARGPINIAQRVSTKYRDLSDFLLGNKPDAINNVHQDDEQICVEILQRWIQGDGMKPISWRTLTDCLTHIDMLALADDIERKFF